MVSLPNLPRVTTTLKNTFLVPLLARTTVNRPMQVGIEYEYKFNSHWGIGAWYEDVKDAHDGDGISSTIGALYFRRKRRLASLTKTQINAIHSTIQRTGINSVCSGWLTRLTPAILQRHSIVVAVGTVLRSNPEHPPLYLPPSSPGPTRWSAYTPA